MKRYFRETVSDIKTDNNSVWPRKYRVYRDLNLTCDELMYHYFQVLQLSKGDK